MSRHPQRNWSVILQQAWNLRLKDKLKFDNFADKAWGKSKEICKRFNNGKCHSGSSCRYEHRCLNCGKFGHGEHICHKRNSGGKTASPAKTDHGANHDRTPPSVSSK